MSKTLTREQQRSIAIKALEQLNIYKPYVKKFESDGTVTLFQRYAGYYVDDTQNQDVLKIIRDFEQETGSLVYAVTEEYFEFGHCYTLLCVSKYAEDARYTLEDTLQPDKFIAFSWVHNASEPTFSEYGSVVVHSALGGIRRCE